MAKKKKEPYFPWYYSDWLGSTNRAMMSPAQRGAYVDLLSHQWADPTCSLPDDDDALSALSGLGEGWFKGASPLLRRCFPAHPTLKGRVANPRLLEVRAERDEFLAKSSQGGVKSQEVQAAKRAAAKGSGKNKGASTTVSTKGGSKRQANPQANGKSPLPSPSPLPSSSSSPLPSPSSGQETSASADVCRARTPDIDAVVAHWRLYHPQGRPGARERRKIGDRLKEGYGVAELREAIDGCHKTPHNLGANERDTKYLALELIMRNSDQVARFIENNREPPRPRDEKERRVLEASERWLERMAGDGQV